MRNFQQVLLDCELTDLTLHGDQFTWCNRQATPTTIRERIDRACADPIWNSIFPNAKCTSLATPYSDHDMLMVDLEPRNHTFRPRSKPFRFEPSWLKEPDCELKILDIWHPLSVPSAQDRLRRKLESCQSSLMGWGGNLRKEQQHRIQFLEKCLLQIRAGEMNATNRLTEEATRKELESILLSEEIYLKQRGKIIGSKRGIKTRNSFILWPTNVGTPTIFIASEGRTGIGLRNLMIFKDGLRTTSQISFDLATHIRRN
ncbi:UNVERIFIED_CONTAM: hypothetical protein Slati_2416700 [Sesamum latifolium]|uniref:Endonuclease/exonuclease/phosphatase domain-containing protein n=1 Tax=Sesamum latifolium TaxID=2727402 RepID=A0AAW2WG31_9LAMI